MTSGREPIKVTCLRSRDDFAVVDALPPPELEVTFIPKDDGTVAGVDRDTQAIVLASVGPRIPAERFDPFPSLRLVQFTGVGTDRVDARALAQRGIAVAGCPAVNADDVAEYTLAAAIDLLRRLLPAHRAIEAGNYAAARKPYVRRPPRALRGLVWGVVGFGTIGRVVGKMAHNHGCAVLYYDIAAADVPFPAERTALDDLLGRADVISIHLPYGEATAGLIDAARIARIRPSSVLINAGRGGIIDETAVRARLDAGTLYGAAFDVFGQEPLPADAALAGGDIDANLLLSPHIAGVTYQAWHALFTYAWSNIVQRCDELLVRDA